jgi:CRP-like cAMP-binding protein
MSDVRALKDRAAELAASGKLTKALAAYEDLAKIARNDPYVAQKTAEVLVRLGKKAEAVVAYQRLVAIYAERDQPLAAIAACRVILSIDPSHRDTLRSLAVLCGAHEGPAQAAPAAQAAPPAQPAPVAQAAPVAAVVAPPAAPEAAPPRRLARPVPLFSDVSRDTFAALVGELEHLTVQAGEAIVRDGEPGTAMYILVRGKARVLRIVNGRPRVFDDLPEPSFFGEIALLADVPRLATVEAVEESELLVLPRAALVRLANEHPDLGEAVLRFFKARLLANVLRANPLFRSFSEPERARFVDAFQVHPVDAGVLLLRQGDEGRGLYVLLRGRCEVAHRAPDGSSLRHDDMTEGDVFGEISLLGGHVTADVRTASPCIVLSMSRAAFEAVVTPNAEVLSQIRELRDERVQRTSGLVAEHGGAIDGSLL